MEQFITGHIKQKNEGCGIAGVRLKACSSLLVKYGISFPPFYAGTINIKLLKLFPTPDYEKVIFISQSEIDSVAPGYAEWWKFIPIKKINDVKIPGYIFRNRQHVHGDDGVELITEDLRNHGFNLSPGQPITLLLEKA